MNGNIIITTTKYEPNQLYYCCKCNINKPKIRFYKDKTKINGIRTICKLCEKEKRMLAEVKIN